MEGADQAMVLVGLEAVVVEQGGQGKAGFDVGDLHGLEKIVWLGLLFKYGPNLLDQTQNDNPNFPFFILYLNNDWVEAVPIRFIEGLKASKMDTFGGRLRDCRKEKGFSQNQLAKALATNHSVLGKYERDQVKPSIEVVKKLALLLGTTSAYLLGEAPSDALFKDPEMLRRLQEINALPTKDREHILYNLDAVLRDVKTRQVYAA